MTIWASFFGLDFIATVPPPLRLVGNLFGTVSALVVFGWIFAFRQFGSAAADYGAGSSRDVLLSQTPARLSTAFAWFLATAIIIISMSFEPHI